MTWLRRIVKTVWVCLSMVGLMALALLLWRRRGGAPVREAIEETRQALDEVRHEAAVEVVAARKEEAVLKQRLRAVKKVDDKMRRRQELLELYREVSR